MHQPKECFDCGVNTSMTRCQVVSKVFRIPREGGQILELQAYIGHKTESSDIIFFKFLFFHV